jgi:hypothetical protein
MVRSWGAGAGRGAWVYVAILMVLGAGLVLWGLSVVPLWLTLLVIVGWVCVVALFT